MALLSHPSQNWRMSPPMRDSLPPWELTSQSASPVSQSVPSMVVAREWLERTPSLHTPTPLWWRTLELTLSTYRSLSRCLSAQTTELRSVCTLASSQAFPWGQVVQRKTGHYSSSGDSLNKTGHYSYSGDSLNKTGHYLSSGDSLNKTGHYSSSGDSLNKTGHYLSSGDSLNKTGHYLSSGDSLNKTGHNLSSGDSLNITGHYLSSGDSLNKTGHYLSSGDSLNKTGHYS